MATYFHGAPEMQPDGLQTLYLMNPSYITYAEAAAPSNMVLLNSAVTSVNPMNLPTSQQPPAQQQHFVGIPLQSASQDSARAQQIHDVPSAVQGLVPRLHYNLWTPPQPQPPQQQQHGNNSSIDMLAGLGRRPAALPSGQQALSLSLSPHEMVPPVLEMGSDVKVVGSDGASGLQSFLMGSKFLKAAQVLLDEVVSVGKGSKGEAVKGANSQNKMKSSNRDSEVTAGEEEESSGKRAAAVELTTAERQELQMKKAKLVNMLDEVEQRYRQYHHQMQIVVSSFEAIAGPGSARTYTALALQTISKQFRCLRDAITGQIKLTSKSLGEEDTKTVGSRLRFVDHHLRQQRALQQLGIIQHNAWRPQRGLPERSVSILRAWLFEHFLHPYPKDSDKLMLAKQTGLTRSQVSNWFINARVRLWKPMVEEMYLEEIKDQEQNDDENSSKSDANERSPATKSSAQQESTEGTDNLKADQGQASTSLQASYLSNGQSTVSYYDQETIMQSSLKKARSNESLQANGMPNSISATLDMKPEEQSNQELLLKFIDERQRAEHQGYSLISPGASNHGGNNYGAYTIGELGRFSTEQFAQRYTSNGVSLTLGLPHCDNLSLAGAQQSFLSNDTIQQPMGRRLDMSSEGSEFCSLNKNAAVAHSSSAYESINIQNRKRFAAQLLPDYVA